MATFQRPWDRFLNWLARLDTSRREIILAALMLVLLFVGGAAGYVYIEGWTWMDGFYMTFITLTTIGFAEIRSLDFWGRILTIGIGFTGIGLVTFVAARSAQILFAARRLQERRNMRKIEKLSDHYILCGYGRVGQRLAEDMVEAGRSFVVIDRDEEAIEELQDDDLLYVQGDAQDEETLQAAGIDRAFGLILSLPDDSINVFVTLTARELNPDVFILARTVDHRNRSKLLNAGANKVIAPGEVGADRMAQVILRPNVDQFLERVLHTSSALSLQIDEVKVRAGAPIAGHTLADSNFRQQFEAIVIGIIDQTSGNVTFNPDPSDRIKEGDVLIVLGDPEMIRSLRERGCTP